MAGVELRPFAPPEESHGAYAASSLNELAAQPQIDQPPCGRRLLFGAFPDAIFSLHEVRPERPFTRLNRWVPANHIARPGDNNLAGPEPAPQAPQAPLEVLAKWPNACLPDKDCVISGIRYPAPNELDARQLQWWLDYLDARLNGSRSLASNATAAILGALFGLVASAVAATGSDSVWLVLVATMLTVLAVYWVAKRLLADADHLPLEQRWLLYRQRARDLAAIDAPGARPEE